MLNPTTQENRQDVPKELEASSKALTLDDLKSIRGRTRSPGDRELHTEILGVKMSMQSGS